MEHLYKLDHNLNIKEKISRIDKYYQFSEDNTKNQLEDNKKWNDCLETILAQLDANFNLICLSPNSESECTKYLLSARSELMDHLVSKELIKKYKYNTRTGVSKVNITKSLEPNVNTHVGLVFFSDYFELNIMLANRKNKKYFHIKEPIPEQHYIIINLDEEEFIPPLSIGNYLLKKEELLGHINKFTEVFKLNEITDNIISNIKNIKKIYKDDTINSETKKVTNFKLTDLQGMANAHNIPLKTINGKKKTKAQLFEELKHLF